MLINKISVITILGECLYGRHVNDLQILKFFSNLSANGSSPAIERKIKKSLIDQAIYKGLIKYWIAIGGEQFLLMENHGVLMSQEKIYTGSILL